jgi:hypothetical protein
MTQNLGQEQCCTSAGDSSSCFILGDEIFTQEWSGFVFWAKMHHVHIKLYSSNQYHWNVIRTKKQTQTHSLYFRPQTNKLQRSKSHGIRWYIGCGQELVLIIPSAYEMELKAGRIKGQETVDTRTNNTRSVHKATMVPLASENRRTRLIYQTTHLHITYL